MTNERIESTIVASRLVIVVAVQFLDDATTSKLVLASPPADKQLLYKLEAGGSVLAKRRGH
jgi:hypothetical protein